MKKIINPLRLLQRAPQYEIDRAVREIMELQTPLDFSSYKQTLFERFGGGEWAQIKGFQDEFYLGLHVPKRVRELFLDRLGQAYELAGEQNLPKAAEAYQRAGLHDKAVTTWRAFFRKVIKGNFDPDKVEKPTVSLDEEVRRCNLPRKETRNYLDQFHEHLRAIGYMPKSA